MSKNHCYKVNVNTDLAGCGCFACTKVENVIVNQVINLLLLDFWNLAHWQWFTKKAQISIRLYVMFSNSPLEAKMNSRA